MRSTNEKSRLDLYEIERRIKPPFSFAGGSTGMSLADFRPSEKWLVGLKMPKQSWVSLFSNVIDGNALFKIVSKSRCLEAVLVGHDPEKRGWYVQVNRAGKAILKFSLPAKNGDRLEKGKFESDEIDASVFDKCNGGKDAVEQLCHELKADPALDLIESDGALRLYGEEGKPLSNDGVYCFKQRGYALTQGDNPASDALQRAIDKCDLEGIRQAVAQGASLSALPDTWMSPLLAALFKCDEPGGKDCVAALVELGCSIHGLPHEQPMVFNCTRHYIPGTKSLEMLKTLVRHGGNVKDLDPRTGETALLTPVAYQRKNAVRFLLDQGVDPTIKSQDGKSVIDWLEDRLKAEYLEDEERKAYTTILGMCTGKSAPAAEALPGEQSALVREHIAEILGIDVHKIGPESGLFDDLGGRPEQMEPLQRGIERALGISLQPIVDGVNVRTAIDEKGLITLDSIDRIQAYLTKWAAHFSPMPFRNLFTVQMIEAMAAKAFEEKAEEPAVSAPLAPEHSAAVRNMIAEEAGVAAEKLKSRDNFFVDLKIRPEALGVLLVRINLKLNIDMLPTLNGLAAEFQTNGQNRLTESSLRRLKRILPCYDFDAANIASFDDFFNVAFIEAIAAKLFAKQPADLPLRGIESDEQQAWVRQLPERLDQRKFRIFLAKACRYAFDPRERLEPDVENALAVLEAYSETGESKRTLRDLRRKFWQEWRVDGDLSYRALHEAINPNDPLPAVNLVARAIVQSRKITEQEAIGEIRRFYNETFSSTS